MSPLRTHSNVIRALRQALAKQVQVPVETVNVELSPGSTLAHAQIEAPNLEKAALVVDRAAAMWGQPLLERQCQLGPGAWFIAGRKRKAAIEGDLCYVWAICGASCNALKIPQPRERGDTMNLRTSSYVLHVAEAGKSQGKRGRSVSTRLTYNTTEEAILAWAAAQQKKKEESPLSTRASSEDIDLSHGTVLKGSKAISPDRSFVAPF
ncbi:CPK2 [Symbiodinium pilosum]|uniref:CPK2 protein n=1 Tax=Symbiodinium pilosum TaxID=2952 RepID=A0A812L1B7_SYMPI|nr:CPK2 [Symbiodinium pilosum]